MLTQFVETTPAVAAPRVYTRPMRLAALCDFAEEHWPSMDLCAAMLLEQAHSQTQHDIEATRVCPTFRRRLGRLPGIGRGFWAQNGDRFLNRHWDFPRHVRRLNDAYDAFHICDHSYSQLAHALPGERTGIFCHDVDAFRCLTEPECERRPRWFRWMMRRVLAGLRKAAVVFHTTEEVKREILRFGLVDRRKLVHAPLGLAPEFSANPPTDPAAERVFEALGGRPFLLHVGSCIPRKRIDFLLRVFIALRGRFSDLRLVKVGGTWSAEYLACIERHRLGPAIHHLDGVARATLAALYHKTNLLMIPSESEGFGLPAIEGLACGAPVLVSDLPVFREVGGAALLYAPPLDLEAWRDTAARVLAGSPLVPPLETRRSRARKFSWQEHARIIFDAYRELIA